MDNRIFATPVGYSIKEFLGEGLNSCVYRAIKENKEYDVKFEVALKILKSEKLVSLWRNEFQRLSMVKSKFCAQLLGWEMINNFPTLVLEYIPGITLSDLSVNSSLTEAQVAEIFRQAREGVLDLATCGVFHGDLNLNNIMIDTTGQVRLIDFGIVGGPGDSFATPKFAAPQILMGRRPNLESDLMSLKLIAEEVAGQHHVRVTEISTDDSRRDEIRSQLGGLVRAIKEFKNNQARLTHKLTDHNVKDSRRKIGLKVAVLLLSLILPFFSRGDQARLPITTKAKSAFLHVRSQLWVSVSIDGGPFRYAPFSVSLPVGQSHLIRWQSESSFGSRNLTLPEGSNIVLGDDYFFNQKSSR